MMPEIPTAQVCYPWIIIYQIGIYETEFWVNFVLSMNDLRGICLYFIQILITALPVLAPLSIAMNAAGMLSKPLVTCSLHWSFPWKTEQAIKIQITTLQVQCRDKKKGSKNWQEQFRPSGGHKLVHLWLCLIHNA